MPITVARGVRGRIRQYRSSIVLQVQRPSDMPAAETALERARVDIANLDGGAAVGARPDPG